MFSELSLDSQTTFFGAVLFVSAMILLSVYYILKFGNRKVFLILTIANVLQFIYYASLFNVSYNQLPPPRFLVNSIEVISMTLYIIAVVLTVSETIPLRWPIIGLNSVSIMLIAVFSYVNDSVAYRRITVGIAVILLFIYGMIFISKLIDKKEVKTFHLLYIIYVAFIVFQLYRVGFRIANQNANIQNFSAVVWLSITSIGSVVLKVLLNYVLLLLNMDFLNKKVRELANIDSLTKCYNRGFFFEYLRKHIKSMKRTHDSFMLALIDIDDFKHINDTYGHIIGDEVLKEFVAYIQDNIRSSDMLGRFGGEEFILFIPGKDVGDSKLALDRLLCNIQNETFSESNIQVKFSGGASFYQQVEEYTDIASLFSEIDVKLYKAKETGKNKIVY